MFQVSTIEATHDKNTAEENQQLLFESLLFCIPPKSSSDVDYDASFEDNEWFLSNCLFDDIQQPESPDRSKRSIEPSSAEKLKQRNADNLARKKQRMQLLLEQHEEE